MLKQQHQKAQGTTLVAQRGASSASTTAQLLTGTAVQQSGTTNVAIPVSAAAINVSLAQRGSLTPTTGQQGSLFSIASLSCCSANYLLDYHIVCSICRYCCCKDVNWKSPIQTDSAATSKQT